MKNKENQRDGKEMWRASRKQILFENDKMKENKKMKTRSAQNMIETWTSVPPVFSFLGHITAFGLFVVSTKDDNQGMAARQV